MRSVLAAVLASSIAVAANSSTFVVSNTADSGPGSLRQAIADANVNPGLDAIDFSIGTGSQTIGVASPLVITSPLIIDGATQEGFAGAPLILLQAAGSQNGLDLAAGADGSAVRNLEIGGLYGPGFSDGAAIAITGANSVTIAGNYIGGVRDFFLRSRTGIRVFTSNNTIGGLTSAERNVCVNETNEVVMMAAATGNLVQGNYFGFDPTGLNPRFPATSAITINGGSNNVVGGTQPGARNVIITSLFCITINNGAQNNRVEGNYLGLGASGLVAVPHFPSTVGVTLNATGGGNVVGGTTAAARNIISNNAQGISVFSQAIAGDLVQGNFVGTDPTGLYAVPNDIGVFVSFAAGPGSSVIGGTAPGEGNLVSGNLQFGFYLASNNAVLQGNFIGTDVTGLAAIPNGQSGIHFQNNGAVIGTGFAAGRNIISGNAGDGIEGSAIAFIAGHAITGNYIGVGVDGVTPLANGGNGITLDGNTGGAGPVIRSNLIAHNAFAGIRLTNATNVVVGGMTAGANTIVANQQAGVSITGSSLGNVVRLNSIDTNAGLGIDLANDGVTANDLLDADTGPNGLQNYPTLARAIVGAGQTVVTGTLSSSPNTSFTIDFYASAAADPSGFGEGAQYLGTAVVLTDGAGQATINAAVANAAAGTAITATATGTTSGTSEFSKAVPAEPVGTLQFLAPAFLTQEGLVATITVTRVGGSAGTITVDYATSDGTATAGQDYTANNGTLTFADGQTTATFAVATTADGVAEISETVQLALSNATNGATVGSPSHATLTILDPSAVPVLSDLATIALTLLLAFIALRSLQRL